MWLCWRAISAGTMWAVGRRFISWRPKTPRQNCFKGTVYVIDSRGCLVHSPDKVVALVGVKDLVVVHTADAILICPRERSQEVKKVVELLEKEGREDLL